MRVTEQAKKRRPKNGKKIVGHGDVVRPWETNPDISQEMRVTPVKLVINICLPIPIDPFFFSPSLMTYPFFPISVSQSHGFQKSC